MGFGCPLSVTISQINRFYQWNLIESKVSREHSATLTFVEDRIDLQALKYYQNDGESHSSKKKTPIQLLGIGS